MRAKWIGLIVGIVALVALGLLVLGRQSPQPGDVAHPAVEPAYVATIAPLGMILAELVRGRASVTVLLQPGQSPHTYDPGPADLRVVDSATGLFHAHGTIDAWAAGFADSASICMFDLLPEDMRRLMPEYHHGTEHPGEHAGEHEHDARVGDGHFWTSPRTVAALVPRLVAELERLDPAGAPEYGANAARFSEELAALDAVSQRSLAPYRGDSVLLFHPSFQYLLTDYGLRVGAVVEPSPGKEPSPRAIAELKQTVVDLGLRAIFTEPQLPAAPAQVLSEETGLPVLVLDPLGGGVGRQTYRELIEYNVRTLVSGLSGESAL